MKFTLIVAAELNDLPKIRHFIRETAIQLNVDSDTADDLILAADEAATNTILHGYQGQPGFIEVQVELAGECFVVCLRDQAPPYDPTQAPPGNLNATIDERCDGGLGTFLMRQCTDSIVYRLGPDGCNELTMRKETKSGG